MAEVSPGEEDKGGASAWGTVKDDHGGANSTEQKIQATVDAAVAASKDGKPAEGGPATATGGAAQAPAGAPAAAAPKEKPAYVRPPPNQKSYMPLFMAPEAYGKKKDPAYELARKAAVEQVAKNAAKKERERLRRKRGAKKKEDVVLTVEEVRRRLKCEPPACCSLR